jgi:hypothetical protein
MSYYTTLQSTLVFPGKPAILFNIKKIRKYFISGALTGMFSAHMLDITCWPLHNEAVR